MKITFESANDVFKRQTYMDEETFRNERNVYPTSGEIYRAEGENVFLLTALKDFLILPTKKLLRTDLPQYDGLIHYGALYKSKPFTIRCGRNTNMQTSFKDVYADRGLFDMTVEDEGITMHMLVTAVSSTNEFELTLDTPTMLYDVEQVTDLGEVPYEFYYTRVDNLFTDPQLYASQDLYTVTNSASGIYTNGTKYEVLFDVAVRSTGVMQTEIIGNSCPIKLYNIQMNGVQYTDVELVMDTNDAVEIKSDGTVILYTNGSNPTPINPFNFGGYKSHGNNFTCDVAFMDTTADQTGTIHSYVFSSGQDLTLGGN